MSIIISTLAVMIVFGLIIFIHEFGHFSTAKLFKVKVHEFAIGMGPCIFKKQKGDILYSLRLIPMGGYVKMEGEEEDSEDENSFSKKKPWQRLIILASGAVMNFILGIIFIIILFGATYPVIPNTTISEVLTDYGAYEAGIKAGDEIYKVNNERISNSMDISLATGDSDVANVIVIRNGEQKEFDVKLKSEENSGKYLGIKLGAVPKNPFNLTGYSFNYAKTIIKLTYKSFIGMFTGNVSVNDMSGPVGIVTEIGSAAQRGIEDVLFILILITLNLGVVNLFPLPALDGGRIVFVIFEMLTRKKLKTEHEAIIHFIGFMLLILFMLYITKNDITRLIFGK